MYLLTSILLIIIVLILFHKKFDNFREKHKDAFNFLLTLIATFVGVFLAIYFTNQSENNKEKQNAIKLLNATAFDLSNLTKNVQTTYNVATIKIDSSYSPKIHIKDNLPELPIMYQNILTNENVLKHLSEVGIKEFYNSNYNLKKMQNIIVSGNLKTDTAYLEHLHIYIKQLVFTQKIVAIETERLYGEISDKNLIPLYQEQIDELIGVKREYLEKLLNK